MLQIRTSSITFTSLLYFTVTVDSLLRFHHQDPQKFYGCHHYKYGVSVSEIPLDIFDVP